MTDYTSTLTIAQDISDTFAFIKDPANLPLYFPRMTSAEYVGNEQVHTTAVVDTDQDGDDEHVESDVWFTVDEAQHRISWGSQGESDYHGGLSLDAGDEQTTLQLSLTTVHDIPDVQRSLDESLAAIASRLEKLSA